MLKFAAWRSLLPNRIRNRIDGKGLGASLLRGAFWSMVAAICARGLAFLAIAIVGRYLGREQFGRLGMVQSTVEMFTVFAGFGLGLASTRAAARYRVSDPAKVGRVLSLSSVVASTTGGLAGLFILIFADRLASGILSDPGLAIPLRIGSISMLFSAANSCQVGTLVGLEAFRTIAKVNVIAGVLTFLFTLLGLFLGGMTGVVLGMAIGWMCTWLLFHFAVRRELRKYGIVVGLKGNSAEFPMLWKFSLPLVLSDSAVTPANWISRSFVANQPSGYSELGIFNAATQITQMLGQAAAVLGAPLLPKLASHSGEGEQVPRHRVNMINMVFFWGLGLAMILPLLACPEVLAWVFGARYGGVTTQRVFILSLLTALVTTFKRGLANALVADGRMWWTLMSNLFWAVVLVGTMLFSPVKGALGLSSSILLAYLANIVVFIPIYMRTGLVPKGSILSWEAGVVWASTLTIAVASYVGLSLWLRLPLGALCAWVVLFAMRRLWRTGFLPGSAISEGVVA